MVSNHHHSEIPTILSKVKYRYLNMTNKRTNPFLDDFVPQSKIHVGLKQFNNNGERLKNVYEKTLALLYKGAKKVQSSNNTHNTVELDNVKDHHLKQLFIGHDGALEHRGVIVLNNTQKLCKCGQLDVELCAYCESPLCERCKVGCVGCANGYCSKCILNWSEGAEMCVSCYS